MISYLNDVLLETKNPYVIAEAGVNHNGDLDAAKRLIDVAAESGADAVKFQSYVTEQLVTQRVRTAEYQQQNTGIKESQFAMLKKMQLSFDSQRLLQRYAHSAGITFISTPFDRLSLDFLVDELEVPFIKVSSADLNNAELLYSLAKKSVPVILSTGMSTLNEIELALGIFSAARYLPDQSPSLDLFKKAYKEMESNAYTLDVALLHCCSAYPAPFQDIHLNAMTLLKETFGLPVGFSDHTEDEVSAIVATTLGAQIIEKHFTLDKSMDGPDHQASLTPRELNRFVEAVKAVSVVRGRKNKKLAESEADTKHVASRKIVASKAIKKGEVFSLENIVSKRSECGIDASNFWDVLGKEAKQAYAPDEEISL